MKKSKLKTRIISFVLAVVMSFSVFAYGAISVSALDETDLNTEGMELGYSIINGYTKLAIKHQDVNATQKTAVYSGLNVKNPYLIMLLGLFYLKNGVDLGRITKDNSYAVQTITELDGFLGRMGIKNEKATAFKPQLEQSYGKLSTSLDTVGFYVVDATNQQSLDLMNNENVDCVLVGGGVPSSLKDLNFDGKSDSKDAQLIQQYLADALVFEDSDEDNYALYASDINEDREINISDVTDLLKN